MKIAILDCIKILTIVYCLAYSFDDGYLKPGYFTEQDLTKMKNIYSSYCYHGANCNESANYKQMQKRSLKTRKICCGGCSCNVSTCVKPQQKISCCPELLNEIASHYGPEKCVHPQMKPVLANSTRLISGVLMVSHCLRNTDIPADYKDKCENSSRFTDLDTKIPVTVHNGTHTITYKNLYCAVCHNMETTEIRYWSPKLDCFQYNFDFIVTPLEQILEEQTSGNCILYFTPPVEVNKTSFIKCGELIGECNVTGQWKVYDPLIEAACQSFESDFQNSFKNVFCFLCNTNEDTMDIPSCRLSETAVVTFSLILKYIPTLVDKIPATRNETSYTCINDEIYDIVQNKCLRIRCLMYSVYIDGECEQIVEKFGGMTFNVFFKLTPLQEYVHNEFLEHEIRILVTDLLQKLRLQNRVDGFRIYDIKNKQRNELGKKETLYLVAYFRLKLYASYYGNQMVNKSGIDFLLNWHERNITMTSFFDDSLSCTFFIEFETSDSVDNFDWYLKKYPALLPVLFCPTVGLNASIYHIEYNKSTLFVKEFDTEIKQNEYIRTDDLTIAVCINTFTFLQDRYKQIKQMQRNTSVLQRFTIAGILSLVCSSVSILCSCITLTVYLRLKSLHTQPGINTMCLCLCLILAQTLFQFGIGQAENIPSWTCSLIGGLIHYFWIVTIMWMNICTFHMFRVFRMLQNIKFSQNLLNTTCLYWLYCGLAALIPVITNMVVTYSKYGRIGYGGSICYITDYRMVGFCFALPVAAVIISNWLLFVTTVHSINSQPTVSKNRRNEKEYLVIYTKMSTLTGLTWTFGLLFFFINIAFLEYIFIIFNAGQGMFLFLSFVCNKRVWSLLFKPKKLESVSVSLKTSRTTPTY